MGRKSKKVIGGSKTKMVTSRSVKGGIIMRDAESGRFVAVESRACVLLASKRSESAAKAIAAKRSAAMKRLADR